MSRRVIFDRFNGKPLTVTIVRNGTERTYTGKQAEKLARLFGLHHKQTFLVYPNI